MESMAKTMAEARPVVFVITPGVQVVPPSVVRVKSEQAQVGLAGSKPVPHTLLLSAANI